MLRDIDGAVVVVGRQTVKELERRAVETARIGGDHRHLIKIRKHAVEKRVCERTENLARAGEENDVPGACGSVCSRMYTATFSGEANLATSSSTRWVPRRSSCVGIASRGHGA